VAAKVPGNTRGRCGVQPRLSGSGLYSTPFSLPPGDSLHHLHGSKKPLASIALTRNQCSPFALRPSPFALRPSPFALRLALRAEAFLIGITLAITGALAQTQNDFIPIDHKGEVPSSQAAYLPNKGQLTALQGGLVPEVLYYSIQSMPQMFFTDKNEVFFQLGVRDTSYTTPDTIYRVGMKFIGPNVNLTCAPSEYEPQSDYWNFILGHLPQPIMGQHAYRRIVYPEVYPHIDFHAYSNPWGPKFYFVMRPGSNPADLKLQFSGQDSLILDAYDQLKAYAGGLSIVLPKGLSYQQINGATVLVDSEVDYELFPGEISVGFSSGTYNPNYPLIIDVSASLGAMGGGTDMEPEWCTFQGHTENDFARKGLVLADGGFIAAGTTTSPSFPLFQEQDGFFDGGNDCYLSEFTDEYSLRYTTLIGGSSREHVAGLCISPDEQFVHILLLTSSTDLPSLQSNGGFVDSNSSVVGNNRDCYLAKFDRSAIPIAPTWLTYFGHRIHNAAGLVCDPLGNVHVAGTVLPMMTPVENSYLGTTGTLPMCNLVGSEAYYQPYYSPGNETSNYEIFYARFNHNTALVHSTLYGGKSDDWANDLVYSSSSGRAYIVGGTRSNSLGSTNTCSPPTTGALPLCQMEDAYYQTNSNSNDDGLIVAFSNTGKLIWATAFGSLNSHESIYRAGVDFFGELYISGGTGAGAYASNPCQTPVGPGFPGCYTAAQYHNVPSPSQMNFASSFGQPTMNLIWSTLLPEVALSIRPDEGNSMTFAMNTYSGSALSVPLQVLPRSNFYFQPQHADMLAPFTEWDSYLLSIKQNKELQYASYFGGFGNDHIEEALPWSGGRLYLVGSSFSLMAVPFHCPPTTNPFCYTTYNTQSSTASEVLYAQVQFDETIGIEEELVPPAIGVYPNPSLGEFRVILPFGYRLERVYGSDVLGRRHGIWGSSLSHSGEFLVQAPALTLGVYVLTLDIIAETGPASIHIPIVLE